MLRAVSFLSFPAGLKPQFFQIPRPEVQFSTKDVPFKTEPLLPSVAVVSIHEITPMCRFVEDRGGNNDHHGIRFFPTQILVKCLFVVVHAVF